MFVFRFLLSVKEMTMCRYSAGSTIGVFKTSSKQPRRHLNQHYPDSHQKVESAKFEETIAKCFPLVLVPICHTTSNDNQLWYCCRLRPRQTTQTMQSIYAYVVKLGYLCNL